jgi:uncharacterized protein (DUF1330 family)
MRAIQQFGGTVIARADPSHIHEAGQSELTVLVRFNSVDEAAALYDSATYREALAALGSGASRDVRGRADHPRPARDNHLVC